MALPARGTFQVGYVGSYKKGAVGRYQVSGQGEIVAGGPPYAGAVGVKSKSGSSLRHFGVQPTCPISKKVSPERL